jgi:multidrug efflux pump
VSLEGADTATVTEWAGKLAARMREIAAAQRRHGRGRHGRRRQRGHRPRQRRAHVVTTATVDDALYNAFGQRIVSTIFTETNQYRVILEAQPGIVTTPSDLSDLQVRTGSGKSTPLSALPASAKPAPLQITHVAQYPATTLGFDTRRAWRWAAPSTPSARRRRTSACPPR